ncbi:uncharacterized protein TNCV_4235621 [Trichonephila clavipes]|nr:uncharacterized protein TNCV_4235621 [Trichonephila clavipes]
MACEIKLLESEATTGFFVLLGEQGNKAVLDWVMKEGLIPSRYECPKCKKGMRLVERKGTIDGFEWRCRVQSKENPYFVCRSVRKGMWFSHSRLSICVILRLTRGKKELIEWCMKEGLIASSYECPKCNEQMGLNERKSVVLDGFECRCRKKEDYGSLVVKPHSYARRGIMVTSSMLRVRAQMLRKNHRVKALI